MKKKLGWIVLGAVVVLIVALGAGVLWIDSLAKLGVEKGGSYALGVDTHLDRLNLKILQGELTMTGLRVANPQGYRGDTFLKSGKFELTMKPASVFGKTIQVTKFELDGLDLFIEQRPGGSNVGTILDHLKRLSGGPKEKEKETKQEKPSEGKKVHVDKVVIKNVQAKFHLLPELSPAGPLTVKVSQIELNDVSSDQGGVVVADLVARILPAILQSVFEAGQGIVPGDFLNSVRTQLHETVKAIGGQTEKLVQQTSRQLGEAAKTIQQGTTQAAKGVLQGILGTKKQQEPSK